MPWFNDGTAALTNGATTVTITGGVLTDDNCRPGDKLNLAGLGFEIAARLSGTTFDLALPYTGATQSGVAYSIEPTAGNLTLYGLAQQLVEMRDRYEGYAVHREEEGNVHGLTAAELGAVSSVSPQITGGMEVQGEDAVLNIVDAANNAAGDFRAWMTFKASTTLLASLGFMDGTKDFIFDLAQLNNADWVFKAYGGEQLKIGQRVTSQNGFFVVSSVSGMKRFEHNANPGGTRLVIGDGETGISFGGSTPQALVPFDLQTEQSVDAVVDLGSASHRFNELHATTLHHAGACFSMRSTATQTISADADIDFGSADPNANDGVSTANGTFTAPNDGIYSLSTYLSTRGGDGNSDGVILGFAVNGSIEKAVFGDFRFQSRADAEAVVSLSDVLALSQGDVVTVRVTGIAYPIDFLSGYCAFSGFLVKAT